MEGSFVPDILAPVLLALIMSIASGLLIAYMNWAGRACSWNQNSKASKRFWRGMSHEKA